MPTTDFFAINHFQRNEEISEVPNSFAQFIRESSGVLSFNECLSWLMGTPLSAAGRRNAEILHFKSQCHWRMYAAQCLIEQDPKAYLDWKNGVPLANLVEERRKDFKIVEVNVEEGSI